MVNYSEHKYRSAYSFACRHCMQNFGRLFPRKTTFKLLDLTPPKVLQLNRCVSLYSNQHAAFYKRKYQNFEF